MADVSAMSLAIEGGWQAVEDVRFEHMWDAKEVCHQDIRLDILTEPAFQTMTGLGGAFSEIGYQALATLPATKQDEIMQQLFGREGARFTFCRVPIGANDFATDAYSLNDTPGDYEMKHFNLDRDRKSLIPFIQAALKINPDLRLHASAWSPPGWLKVNGQMVGGGKLIEEPRVYAAYAKYLRMFVQAYAAEGITITRLVLQNEPECGKGYPTCTMPPEQMNALAVQYLAPELKAAGLTTEIWAGTHTRLGGLYPFHALRDDAFAAVISGLGFQYELPEKMVDLVRVRPGLRMMHTESHCHMGLNRPVEAAALYEDVWDFITAGCDNFTYWNMILNETGQSGWGWRQNSLVVVDRAGGTFQYGPDLDVMKLLSRAIAPLSRRLPTHCLHLRRVTAFARPDGKITAVLYNTANAKKATFCIDNRPPVEVQIPGQSLVTVEL
ncbi:MAG: hypothetical protein LLG01_12150 [Planctomycetaceae bacterium]|nr:hypothetical protein [Planctomycetaceae bacterium]